MYEHGLKKGFGGKFVDVGCGTGRPVFAACLLHDFDSCVGIEILTDLYKLALKVP
jgi:ubiquinone/menaquinone biosynthesis C-methylase UbiE